MPQAKMQIKYRKIKAWVEHFEKAINSADAAALKELVDPKVPFLTPASPQPFYGGEGVLCGGKDDAR